jgi:RecA/RadA recombinase
MAALSPDVTAALASLRSRWGAAAPAVVGALATAPLGAPSPDGEAIAPRDERAVFSTGFPALDAILGPGGLPRGMGLSVRGDLSSGRTTLALRLVAEAQAAGSIVAWLDLAAALDPVEAVSRGVRLEWLVVVTPASADEGIAIAGSLLAGRAVDLLVVDLPPGIRGSKDLADRLGRLAALARRAGISVVVLEPPALSSGLASAVGEATGIRLELARRSWIHLGRDVVGQRTEVVVARNRAGPPGRRAVLRILYADGGERDACLRRDGLLAESALGRASAERPDLHLAPPVDAPVPGDRNDATPPSLSPAPPPRSRPTPPALRVVAGGAGRPRRQAVVARQRARHRSEREGARGPARDAARDGTPPGAGGDLPRAGSRR